MIEIDEEEEEDMAKMKRRDLVHYIIFIQGNFDIKICKNRKQTRFLKISSINNFHLSVIFTKIKAKCTSFFPQLNGLLYFFIANSFYYLTIHSSLVILLFTIHKLYNTMQVKIILNTFLKGIWDCFIINLHLCFKIPNAFSIHILVET